MLALTITTSNAAFGETREEKATEVARILREVANDLEFEGAGARATKVYDYNGNNVGSYRLD